MTAFSLGADGAERRTVSSEIHRPVIIVMMTHCMIISGKAGPDA
jgi:hypothetical protein